MAKEMKNNGKVTAKYLFYNIGTKF